MSNSSKPLPVSFLVLFFILILSECSSAQGGVQLFTLQDALGVLPDGKYKDEDLLATETGTIISGIVIDPTKLGGCQKGDKIELKNIGNGKWEINHFRTGQKVIIKIIHENDAVKVERIPFLTSETFKTKDHLDLAGRYSIGINVSYINVSDDTYTVFGVEVDTKPDESAMFGVNLTYFLSDYFSVELSVNYAEIGVDLSALGSSGKAGDITQVPLILTGRLNIPIKNKAVPYIGGGLGFFFNSFDQKDEVIEFIYGSGADVDVDNSFGFLVNGGIDFFVTPNFALNFDIKYIWNEIETTVNASGFQDEKLEANMFSIGVGIKYYF